MARANEQVLQLRDTNVQRSFADEVSFMAENLMARSAWAPFVTVREPNCIVPFLCAQREAGVFLKMGNFGAIRG